MKKFLEYVELRDFSEVELPPGWGIYRGPGDVEKGGKPQPKFSSKKILASLSKDEWKNIYDEFIKHPRTIGDRPDVQGFRKETYRHLIEKGLEDMADYVLHTEKEGGAPSTLIRSVYTSLGKNPQIDPEGASTHQAKIEARREKRKETKQVKKFKDKYTPESLDDRIKQIQAFEQRTGLSYVEWVALYVKEKVGGSISQVMKGLKNGEYDRLLFDDSPTSVLNMLERSELGCRGGPEALRHPQDPTKYAYERGAQGQLVKIPKPQFRVNCGLSPFEIKTILETIRDIDLSIYDPEVPEDQKQFMASHGRPGQLKGGVVSKLLSKHGD